MTDLNKVILIGRLTQDCGADEKSFQYVGNGIAKATVSLAVNRSIKKNGNWVEDTSFFNVTIWGKTAENLKPYLTKGKQICVRGYVQQDRWVDNDGNKKSRISIVADNVQLLGGRGDGQSGGNQMAGGAPRFQLVNNAGQNNGYSGGYQSEPYVDTGSDFPEDIPFGN